MTPASDLIPYVDESSIATGVAARFLDRILSAAEDGIRRQWAKRKGKQASELAQFIRAQINNYKHIKNILYYNEPAELDTLYVPLSFSKEPFFYRLPRTGGLSDTQVLKSFVQPTRSVICATAGAGKSFFMRKALLSLSSGEIASGDRIPIFFELRNLNGKPKQSLFDALIAYIRENVPSFMPEQLSLGLSAGAFIVMLDGYDEIEPAKTQHYETEILSLARQYPDTSIVVSTRPMESILAWEKFRIYHICPLSKQSAIKLVERLPFDEGVRKKFIDETERYLYDQHESFMSTPLLITMMLITFSETAEINSKLTAFYNAAFHALFVRHDAKKEAFRRTLASDVSREDFENLFATFCFLTYSVNQYQFPEDEALRHIRKTCDLQEIDADPNLVFQDFCVTSCMLVKEGTRFLFSHRSFQEYFTAVFINRCPDDIATKLLKELSDRADRDNVLSLLLELNPELVERHWVLPKLKQINKAIEKFAPSDRARKLVSTFFEVETVRRKLISEEPHEFWSIGFKGQMGFNLVIISQLYRFPIFGALDLDAITQTRGRSGNTGVPRRKSPARVKRLVRRGTGRSRVKTTDDVIEFLRSLQDRIETAYARKKTKLEEIVAKAMVKR